jgi:hypothetical protein
MEQPAWLIGKVGFTIQKQIIASLKATADVVQLDLKRRLHVKNVNATNKPYVMKRLILLPIFLCYLLTACEKPDLAIAVPNCIENKIQDIQNAPVENPPKEVWLWEYNGVSYYYFTAACCDQFSELYDADCNLVCAPDGGFTGMGDGNCVPGILNATKTLIWKDPR